jgi:hypothetical protein
MNLIKIGTRIVNLDMVTNVDLAYVNSADQSGVRVYFGAESETFRGSDAVALTSWLESVSADVIAAHTNDLREQALVARAAGWSCPTCGGEGNCPDCGISLAY